MKKHIILSLVISILAVGMTACGTDETDSSSSVQNNETTVSDSYEQSEETTKAEKKISTTETTAKVSDTSVSESTTEKTVTSAVTSAATSVAATTSNGNTSAQNNNNNNNTQNNNSNNYQDNNNYEQSYENNDNNYQDNNNIDNPSENNTDAEFIYDDLVFEYNGQTINLDENINDVKAKIGEPLDMVSAPSCYYDGDDKTFIYDGFSINTYPDGDNDYVVSIELNTDAVSTIKGAKVGMSIDDAIALYGNNYTQNGSNYQYQIDDKYMYFYVENGTVSIIGIVYAN
jgi:hypothetical protein